MHWIALHWPLEPRKDGQDPQSLRPGDEALGWWALQFTPRVVWVDEALLLEVSACERLWGGRMGLMRQIAHLNPAPSPSPSLRLRQVQGATSLVALARLRLYARGERPPADLPAGLPLDTLSAARPHLDVLAHLGCRTWGEVAALPRGGFTRRFGKPLRDALDAAWGLQPEAHRWLALPEVFEQKLELPALAEGAPELMWSANRLLAALAIWLRARQRGAVALELQWTLDLRRCNGVELPPHQQITVRTAEPTQDMAHLRRLMAEKLALTRLAAPAGWLRLRTLETTPWAGASASFLPEDNRKGDKLHQLVERLSARLGARQVLRAVAQADHRPERMQAWQPALQPPGPRAHAGDEPASDAMYPPWLLAEPRRLEMNGERPCWHGPLRQLIGPQKVETGWWGGVREGEGEGEGESGRLAVREYFVAESPGAGLVWIFRERSRACFATGEVRWYLQGLYA
jgi:protein ImuB